jgi:hypothetical protein
LEVSENLSQLGYCFYLVDDLNGEITRVEKLTPETDGAGKVLMNRLNRIALPNESASLIKKLY